MDNQPHNFGNEKELNKLSDLEKLTESLQKGQVPEELKLFYGQES